MKTIDIENLVVNVDRDLEDLIDGFLENRNREIIEIEAAVAAGDVESIGKITHDLIGSGKTYGFNFITYFGRDIKKAVAEGDMTQALDLLKQLKEAMKKVEIQFVEEE